MTEELRRLPSLTWMPSGLNLRFLMPKLPKAWSAARFTSELALSGPNTTPSGPMRAACEKSFTPYEQRKALLRRSRVVYQAFNPC